MPVAPWALRALPRPLTPNRCSPGPAMRKERVITGLLGAAAALGVTTLILILVEATNILLPTDTKVWPRP